MRVLKLVVPLLLPYSNYSPSSTKVRDGRAKGRGASKEREREVEDGELTDQRSAHCVTGKWTNTHCRSSSAAGRLVHLLSCHLLSCLRRASPSAAAAEQRSCLCLLVVSYVVGDRDAIHVKAPFKIKMVQTSLAVVLDIRSKLTQSLSCL